MDTPVERSPSTVNGSRSPENNAFSALKTLDDLLSYPATSELSVPLASSSASSAQPRQILKDRLYVGNLHPTVDEYTLLQLFSKFGKVSKLDYLFHKSGPLKGKPRGYAFVEFANKDDAEKALIHANDKLLRGRKLIVTYANQAPLDAAGASSLGGKSRRPVNDAGKPTTLSLLKSAGAGRSDATDAKIARMEAKLRQLESTSAAADVSARAAGPSLPGHPSLPPKPVAAPIIPSLQPAPTNAAPLPAATREKRRGPALPILPIKPPTQPVHKPAIPLATAGSTPSPPRAPSVRKSALTGVRIVKPKTNQANNSSG